MTPWELASKTEHSQQRALFAWANCAALYGFVVAADPRGYSQETRGAIAGWPLPPPAPALRLLFAVHNQGHGDKIRGAMAKAEGVKAGVPDVMLPVSAPWFGEHSGPDQRHYGLFIELKRPGSKGVARGRASAQQVDWIGELQQQGYYAATCVGWIEAANVISWYLGSTVRVS